MAEKKTNILIIGAGHGCVALLEVLSADKRVNILGVVDADLNAPGIDVAKRLSIPVSKEWNEFLKGKNLNQVIDLTGKQEVNDRLLKEKPDYVDIVGGSSAKLIWFLLEGRKEAQESVRRLSRAIEQSPSAVVMTDLKGNVEYANPKFSQLTGFSLDEVKGRNPKILKS
ncbi:PAS domain S-box protein, partial [Candidatus Omnitrophota bacterium]